MKNLRPWILTLTLLTVSSISCAPIQTMGNPQIAQEETTSKIQPGVSTKSTVHSLLGAPNTVSMNPGNEEVWQYQYLSSRVRPSSYIPIVGPFVQGVDTEMRALMVTFNSAGVVKSIAGTPGAANVTQQPSGVMEQQQSLPPKQNVTKSAPADQNKSFLETGKPWVNPDVTVNQDEN